EETDSTEAGSTEVDWAGADWLLLGVSSEPASAVSFAIAAVPPAKAVPTRTVPRTALPPRARAARWVPVSGVTARPGARWEFMCFMGCIFRTCCGWSRASLDAALGERTVLGDCARNR